MVCHLLISLRVVHPDGVFLRNEESIHALNMKAVGAFKVVFYNVGCEAMSELSCIDIEACLIVFVCDAEFDFWSEHHLTTIHKIEHDVFQNWHHGFSVYEVKVYLLIRGNLYTFVAFDEVDKTPDVECMILNPKLVFFDLIINFLIKLDLA